MNLLRKFLSQSLSCFERGDPEAKELGARALGHCSGFVTQVRVLWDLVLGKPSQL